MAGRFGDMRSGTPCTIRVWILGILWISVVFSALPRPTLAQVEATDDAQSKAQEIIRIYQEGRYDDAVPKAREWLARNRQDLVDTSTPVAGQFLWLLADLFTRAGDYATARPLGEQRLHIQEQILGPTHPSLVRILYTVAFLRWKTSDYAGARALGERMLQIQEQTLGPDHREVVTSLEFLSLLLLSTGDYASARPFLERVLRITEVTRGPRHPDVAEYLNRLGVFYWTTGDYAAARLVYERALKIQQQGLGLTHPDVAVTLNNLAELSRTTGDYPTAKSLHEQALRMNEQAFGPNHPTVATSLNNLGHLLHDLGEYAAALRMYERALTIREQALGPTHPDVAMSLNDLAAVLQSTGDYAAARPLYERALMIWERAVDPSRLDVALGLNNLAGLLRKTGEYALARQLYERALGIREQVLGPNHSDMATSLTGLANLLRQMGDYSAARPLYERAMRINEQALGANHPRYATSLNDLALLYSDSGDYAGAGLLLERALRIQEQTLGPTHPDVAYTLNNIAALHISVGDYAGARPLHERGLRILMEALGPNHPSVAPSLNNFAMLLALIGDYGVAKLLYEWALEITEHSFGPNHPNVATSLNNLGELLRITGDYKGAQSLYERALRIFEQTLGPAHPQIATSLNNLAELLRASGDYARAEALYQRAIRIDEEAFGTDHQSVGTSLSNLAALLAERRDYTRARSLYERALGILTQSLGPDHPRLTTVLENMGLLELQTHRPGEALPRLARVIEIARAHTARGLVGTSQRQKLAFLKITDGPTDAFLSIPPGLAANGEVYKAVQDRKNLLLRTVALERTLPDASAPPEVAALVEEYAAVRRKLASIVVGVPNASESEQHKLDFTKLSLRLDRLELELSRASAVFRKARVEATGGPLEVCSVLPMDAALMDLFWYWRFLPPTKPDGMPSVEPHYVAFVLRGEACADPIRVDLGSATSVDEDVKRFREAISRNASDPAAQELRARYRKTVATRLKEKLFPPEVQEAIAGKPQLIISPDAALALLPFTLLPGEEGHEFLLETRTISYVPSGRDLLRAKDGAPTATALLAVGAPAFDRVPTQGSQVASVRAGCGAPDDPFFLLPGTAQELQAIASVARQARPTQAMTLLEGTQATKPAFLEQAPKAGVLHLATHAYFAGEECTPAGLAAAPSERPLGETPVFLGHNPLLLAGIALAGANEREKADGILTALEITALDLKNTDLVVLSACDTGLGTIARGQELLGLRWAFAYAGARHLVTSLWGVSDAETATLMTHFYSGLWAKGLSVAEALRAAQLEMLKAARARGNSAPHTWGAFVVSGINQ